MPADPRAVVERIYDHWGRGDFAFTDLLAPDVRWYFGSGEFGETFGWREGLEDIGRAIGGFLTVWTHFCNELEELRELEDGRLLGLNHQHGQGRASGVEMHSHGVDVWTVRDGLVVTVMSYIERAQAEADLGIELPRGESPT
jgi:ketosteroid isomerase-like protein